MHNAESNEQSNDSYEWWISKDREGNLPSLIELSQSLLVGTEKNHETPLKIDCLRAEIYTRDLP
jgi:hypothetical protein